MDHIPGTAGTTQGGFDPRQAAALLDQATRQARRAFTPLTPLLFTFRAAAVLVVFGGCWLSVRGQHPYTGHINGVTGTGLGAVYLGIAAFTARRQRRSMVRP